jgi:tetratricopeptide (TPR) repeat protein
MSSAAALAPTPEQTKVATQQFERANQAVNSQNFDYGIELLQTCCKLDPANLIYRRRLRHVQKAKYHNNLRGSPMAWLTTWFTRRSMKSAFRRKQDLEVLELGEIVLSSNPWDTKTQLLMGLAAERIGMRLVAIFLVEHARMKNPNDPKVNRPLAELYERSGAFTQAIAAWQLVARYDPADRDAAQKAKDLAATHTIRKGHYQERTTGNQEESKEGAAAMEETGQHADPTELEVSPPEITDPQEILAKAQTHKQAKQWDEAREVLVQGLQATNNNFELQQALADLEIEPFRQDLLLTRQKLKENPRNTHLQDHQEQLRKEIANREMALFRDRSDRYPQDLKAKLELGIRLLQLEQIDEAIAELQHARRDPQLRGKALVHLGLAFLAKDNWPLAKRNLDEALLHLPANDAVTRKEVLYQLALAAAEQKDLKQALAYGHECASLDFQYKDLRQKMMEWQGQAKTK